jgi:hypothetical protein
VSSNNTSAVVQRFKSFGTYADEFVAMSATLKVG